MKHLIFAIVMIMGSTAAVANGLTQSSSCRARQVESTQPLADLAEQCMSEFLSAAAYSLQCGLEHATEADYVQSPYFRSASDQEGMEPLATLLTHLGFEHFQITWQPSERLGFDYVLTIRTFTAGNESGSYEVLSMYTERADIQRFGTMEYHLEGELLVEKVSEINTFGAIYLVYPQWQHCADGRHDFL